MHCIWTLSLGLGFSGRIQDWVQLRRLTEFRAFRAWYVSCAVGLTVGAIKKHNQKNFAALNEDFIYLALIR